MTWMFEVYYSPPRDLAREEQLSKQVKALGGRLDFHEEGNGRGICLTYEFDDLPRAEHAVKVLRNQGEHVEGPSDYGE